MGGLIQIMFNSRWVAVVAACLVVGCGSTPSTTEPLLSDVDRPDYVIGPGDTLAISVWRSSELNAEVQVRPDGRISVPLVDDLVAVGKTPTALATDLEAALAEFIRSPNVTVIVRAFGVGAYGNQIRVVGPGAAAPQAIPYRDGLTLLDVVIEVGLTEFAAANRALLVRRTESGSREARVRLSDLINRGELEHNLPLLPGDVLVIPQSRF